MARIETRVQTPLQRTESVNVKNVGQQGSVAGGLAVTRPSRPDSLKTRQKHVKRKRSASLPNSKEILASDVHPLRDRSREDLVAEITRILSTIREIEDFEGENDTTKLCKIMLNEHIRRLMLVEGTQVASDGLKGSV